MINSKIENANQSGMWRERAIISKIICEFHCRNQREGCLIFRLFMGYAEWHAQPLEQEAAHSLLASGMK